jgi:hypothetical protein
MRQALRLFSSHQQKVKSLIFSTKTCPRNFKLVKLNLANLFSWLPKCPRPFTCKASGHYVMKAYGSLYGPPTQVTRQSTCVCITAIALKMFLLTSLAST